MRSRLLSLAAPLLVVSPLLPAGTTAAAEPSTTTSTVTTSTTSTTSTTAPATTPTTVPPTAGPPTTPTTSSSRPVPAPPADGDEPVDESFVLPPDLQARVNAVRRSAPNDNAELLDTVRAYAESAHVPLEQAMVLGLGHFPVAGAANWVHDWLHPRRGPPVHLHQGTDLWAATGTPLRAPYAGRLRYEDAGLGGLAAYITAADGTYYYLAHMAGTAPGLASGATVTQGQIIGFVGDSGNARGGAAHLHFEIHPRGGAAVDPKPILDRWVKDATVYAFALATNPTATTAPQPDAGAPVALDGRPTIPTSAGAPRAARAAHVSSGGNPAGRIFVIGSFLALCGGRLMRRVRAKIAPAPADE